MLKPVLIMLAVAAVSAFGCGARRESAPEPVIERRGLMGTEVTITAWDPEKQRSSVNEAVGAAFDLMERLEAGLSRHRPESEISELNRSAGKGPYRVSAELLKAVLLARNAYEASGGAFDPTVGPLVRLWISAAKSDRIPPDEEIEAACAYVGFSKIAVHEQASEIELPDGMSLDLGGIAKGMIVDEAAGLIRAAGVSNAIVEAGGDLFAFGCRPDGSPWRIGIQDPSAGEDTTEGLIARVIEVSGRGVTTSGHYRRYSTIQGRKFSHILDPRTGRPVEHSVLSATVIARDAAWADGLSTAVAVLGPHKGIEFLESLEGVEGLVIARSDDAGGGGTVLETSGLKPFAGR